MASYYNFKVTPYRWHEMNGFYVIDDSFFISMDDGKRLYTFKIHRGFMTDGGSIPKIFSWFAKGWSNDYRYNAAYILHDWLYASGILKREIADDMLRSALRDCGMNRFHASTICWAVNNFASSHYGIMNDDLDCAGYGELVSIIAIQ